MELVEVSSGSDPGNGKRHSGSGVRSTAGTGSFSCFHGEAKRPPVDDAPLRGCSDITTRYIDEFYNEAARRLPLKEMPELDACVEAAGVCFGLADPVANIILNAVGLLHHLHGQEGGFPPPPTRRATRGFAGIATRSLLGLRGFMNVYFRYFGHTDGCRYLYLASHDLRLAIALVHHDRFSKSQRRPLLPDGGNLRAALRVAALDANHPFPDVLARFMTAQYPSALLYPVLAKLQAPEQQLTTRDVSEIRDLLARQWPPPTPPVNLEFWCRPNGADCSLADDGTLLISTCIGEGRVATISIANANANQPPCDHQLGYISDVTFQREDMEIKISDCLHRSAVGIMETTDVDYDASPCTHKFVLEMCLLETIRECYIKALAVLPSSPRLLRALIVAGHCYGPFDPLRNIIVNTIWYDIAFPLAPDAQVDLPWGIINTRPLSRLETRSLSGLVQMVCVTLNKSRHEALEYLNSLDCDLSRPQRERLLGGEIADSVHFDFVAKAAKHPQHAAHGSFLMSLSPERINCMRCLLTLDGGIPDWSQVRESILSAMPVPPQQKEETLCSLSPFASMQISMTKSSYMNKLAFVSTELNKALHKYCNQHPWEPAYQLDIICGVRASKSHSNQTNFYHANFLASTVVGDGVVTLPHERTLFFAEFWVSPSPEDVQSKPSICCPIYDYNYACTGRCYFCEGEGIKIMHPPSGGYFGVIDRLNPRCPSYRVDFKSVLDSDLIYFDPDRDVELAKVINDFRDYYEFINDIPLVTCTPKTKPSLVWGWNGDDYNPFGPLPEIPEHKFTLISGPEINLAFSRFYEQRAKESQNRGSCAIGP